MRRIIIAILALAMGASLGVRPATAAPQWTLYPHAYVHHVGWTTPVADGAVVGTTGRSLRMEALASPFPGVLVRAHIQNVGWQPWVSGPGWMVGTPDSGLRLEAIRIHSTVPGKLVRCQAHVQNIGWMAPVDDGRKCGTTGRSLRLEAVRLWLVDAPESFSRPMLDEPAEPAATATPLAR